MRDPAMGANPTFGISSEPRKPTVAPRVPSCPYTIALGAAFALPGRYGVTFTTFSLS
jgi:hypothetical protein